MALNGAIKIIIKIAISIEMKKVAEIDRVLGEDFLLVFGVEVEGAFLVVGVVGFFVLFFDFDLVDVAIVDVGEEATKKKLFALFAGEFEFVGKAIACFKVYVPTWHVIYNYTIGADKLWKTLYLV